MSTSRDRMDRVIAEARRQGFKVWQKHDGTWMFRTGNIFVEVAQTPTTFKQWYRLMHDLARVGLVWPDEPLD